jgi:hypothetical protein
LLFSLKQLKNAWVLFQFFDEPSQQETLTYFFDNTILLLSHHGTSILIEPPLNKPLAISTCNPWFPKPTLYSRRHQTLCSFNVPPLHSNTQWLKTEHQSVADPEADSHKQIIEITPPTN